VDPVSRRTFWALIRRLADEGTTILVTTHYMDEAERLCDRVALLDRGRLVALGRPSELAAEVGGGKHVRFVPSQPVDDRLLLALPEVQSVEHHGQHVLVTGTGELVNAVILTLAAAGVAAKDVTCSSATLENAFLRLTGRHLHDDGTASSV
jgi:ABC-2 type transport system ATP-binding protein